MIPDWDVIQADILNLNPCQAINKISVIKANAQSKNDTNEDLIIKLDNLYDKYISILMSSKINKEIPNYPDLTMTSREREIVECLSKADPPFTIEELCALTPQINIHMISEIIKLANTI